MITIINSDKQKQLDWCVNGNKSMITQTIKNKIRDIIQASKEIESVALSAGEKTRFQQSILHHPLLTVYQLVLALLEKMARGISC